MQGDKFIENVRHRAYEIWKEAGRPIGFDIDHWLQAETECRTEMAVQKALEPSPEPPEKQPKPARTSRPRQKPKRSKS
jgi:hypothetical protein